MTKRNNKLCVKIAYDVLAQLRLGRYKASHTYVDLNFPYGEALPFGIDDLSFKNFFKKKKSVTCNVCALGSAFVSLVNIKNQCSVGEMECGNSMFERLENVFGARNMSLMESAFETGTTTYGDIHWEDHEVKAAVKWGEQYEDDTKRLRTIMLNIIRNNGDFKLPKKYIAQAKRLKKTAW